MFWTNDLIHEVIDREITEYDIKSGNTSIMRIFQEEFNPPISEFDIKRLELLDKQARVVEVGRMLRDHKGFANVLEKGFNTVVKEFIEANQLNQEDEILSIKRDAVFTTGLVTTTTIREYAHFIPKNTYQGYFRIPGFEFLYNTDNERVDVKGLQDELLPLHEQGILQFIRDAYHVRLESGHRNSVRSNSWMAEFLEAYLHKELPFDYYREFNSESRFRLNIGGNTMMIDSVSEENVKDLDISYNHQKILIPFIGLFLR